MNLRKLLLALSAGAMLASIFASGASAAAVTPTSAHWTDAGTSLVSGESRTVKCSVGTHNGSSTLALTGTIGEGAGVPTELTATGIECINHEGTEGANGTAKIEQSGTAAIALGRLKFTGIKVVKPEHCTVASTITTNPLKAEIYMHESSINKVFTKFEPTGTNFATVVVGSEAGFTCAIAGNRIVKGFVFGQSVEGEAVENPTSTGSAGTHPDALVQSLTFSPAIDTTAGSSLTFAGNAAHLTGRVNNELTNGHKWGAME